MKNILNGKVGYFLKLSFAATIITYLIKSGNLDFQLFKKLWHPIVLPLAFLIPFVGVFLNNFRWWLLGKSQHLTGTLTQFLKWTLIGIFFNYAFPSSIGGDVVKGYYLTALNKNNKWGSISSVIVDRVMGLFSMISLTFISLILNYKMLETHPDIMKLFYLVLFLFIGILVFLTMSFSKSFNKSKILNKFLEIMPNKICSTYEILHKYGESKKVIFVSIVLSFMSQTLSVFFMYIIGNFLIGEQLPFLVYLFAVPLGFMIMSIPLTPAGLGVGQLAFLNLFQIYLGKENMAGQLAITAYQVVLFIWGILGAYFYISGRKLRSLYGR